MLTCCSSKSRWNTIGTRQRSLLRFPTASSASSTGRATRQCPSLVKVCFFIKSRDYYSRHQTQTRSSSPLLLRSFHLDHICPCSTQHTRPSSRQSLVSERPSPTARSPSRRARLPPFRQRAKFLLSNLLRTLSSRGVPMTPRRLLHAERRKLVPVVVGAHALLYHPCTDLVTCRTPSLVWPQNDARVGRCPCISRWLAHSSQRA